MRTREEIRENVHQGALDGVLENTYSGWILEVLLDIRDLLDKKAECHRPDMEDVLKGVDKQVGGALRRL